MVNTVGFGLLEATGKRGSILTKSGAFSAYLLGLVLWTTLGGWGWGTCVLYLMAGSAVTKVKMAKKEVKKARCHKKLLVLNCFFFLFCMCCRWLDVAFRQNQNLH